ncbi:multi antimicrobial extrusion protein [Kipferlia bialata]|uniref:Multi antimicrobial extrusion protein n=1 Tax=Kipferlia bialata TaxID=797122 RepID=A0A9K3CWB9_9EUKA|nr:multi antimicrobial extrusion protein [Kipferlia bialata]|eukprot:g5647.t1
MSEISSDTCTAGASDPVADVIAIEGSHSDADGVRPDAEEKDGDKVTASTARLGVAPIGRLLLGLCVPTCISMTIGSVYNIIDSIFIGKYTGLSLMAGVGAAAVLSVLLGKGDVPQARIVMAHFLLIGFVIAVGIPICVLPSLEWLLLNVLGCTEAALPYAMDYGRVIFLYGGLGYFCATGVGPLLRVENMASIGMWRQLISSLLNILGDPLFMSVLDLGIAGAAYSTSFALISVGMTMLVFYFHPKSKSNLHPDLKSMLPFLGGRIQWSIIKDILSIGIGMWIAQLPPSIGAIVSNVQAVKYAESEADSEIYLAALGLFSRVVSLIFMPMAGITQGLLPVVGFSLGARKWARMRQACMYGTAYQLWFTDDEAVIEQGAKILRVGMSLSFLQGITQIVATIAQVYKQIAINASVQLIKPLLVIVFVYVLPPFMGVDGIWTAYPIADILAAVISTWLLVRYMKKIKKEEADDAVAVVEEGKVPHGVADTVEAVGGESEGDSDLRALEGIKTSMVLSVSEAQSNGEPSLSLSH